MKSNGLLKWLLVPVLLLAVWIGARHWASRPVPTTPRGATPAAPLTPTEMADLGVAADTPRDTVATLVGQVQRLRSELQSSARDTQAQQAADTALRERLTQLDEQLQTALQNESAHWQQQSSQATSDASEKLKTQDEIEGLKSKLDALSGKGAEVDLPSGLGLPEGNGTALPAPPETRWVDPLGPPAAKTTTSSPANDPFQAASGFGTNDAQESPAGTAPTEATTEQVGTSKSHASAPVPVYTVPANSTLMGSVAMTALIGRIAVDGTVTDPYPFKVLVGPDNLTANGIDLPNVAGAVMSGTASGDWTLSCVRGEITSVTFVFRDGTVRTVPEGAAAATADAGSGARSSGLDGVGWISDPYGIPCVSGERRSNAKQYLTSQMLITAAGAGAASLIRDQNGEFSYVAGANGESLGTVGISGNEAMGRILSGGVEAMSQWVNKLYGQAFAAVYVAPGARVAVHIVRSINVDYDPSARRVRYDAEASDAPNLD